MGYFNGVDWKDILAHTGVAFLLALVLTAAGAHPGAAWLITFAVFFVRGVVQDYEKGRSFPDIWPIRRSSQKDAEAIGPFFGAFFGAWLASNIGGY